jgi:hypothetical protein
MIRLRHPPILWPLVLATAATGTAVCVSVLAGWQRGGWLAERLIWVATGVVLVVSAHLLPALSRSAPPMVRCISAVLWVACMAAASYGHATFFLMSQQHAGDARAASVVVEERPAHRSLTAVMAERADVTAALARANAQRCVHDCTTLRVRRVSLAAKLDALEAESDEVRRERAAEDRHTAQRETLRDDPVTSRLGTLLSVSLAHLDLFAGLAFAAVLEGVACLFWWLVWQSPKSAVGRVIAMTQPVIDSSEPVTASPASNDPVTPVETEVTKLVRDIAAGLVRPTVSGIRQHLGCSQAKASALRKQLIASSARA